MNQSRLLAQIGLVFTTLAWGATFVLVKDSLEFAKPFTFIFFRFIIATLAILPFIFLKKEDGFFKNFNNDENATTALFLDLISVVPDSLIARKYGIDKAKEVSSKFLELSKEYSCSKNPNSLNNQLLLMDSELKIQGLNPGTTADVVVASIFLNRLGL